MLFPKKVKHRKWQTLRRNPHKVRIASRGIELSFGSYGLKAMSEARVRSNQIESARKTLVRQMGKSGKLWIRIFPDKPFTKKPPEVKLGKGKGEPVGYEVEVLPGRIMFEVDGLDEVAAREALRKAGTKLPLKSKVITRMH